MMEREGSGEMGNKVTGNYNQYGKWIKRWTAWGKAGEWEEEWKDRLQHVDIKLEKGEISATKREAERMAS